MIFKQLKMNTIDKKFNHAKELFDAGKIEECYTLCNEIENLIIQAKLKSTLNTNKYEEPLSLMRRKLNNSLANILKNELKNKGKILK